jgi:hypothetical protein
MSPTSYLSTPATVPLTASADSLRVRSPDFLAGVHGLLALPQGHADHLAALTVSEGDEPFEPVLLLDQGQDPLPDVAQSFVHLVGGPSNVLILARTTTSLLFPFPRREDLSTASMIRPMKDGVSPNRLTFGFW